jgi:hypothetical protein
MKSFLALLAFTFISNSAMALQAKFKAEFFAADSGFMPAMIERTVNFENFNGYPEAYWKDTLKADGEVYECLVNFELGNDLKWTTISVTITDKKTNRKTFSFMELKDWRSMELLFFQGPKSLGSILNPWIPSLILNNLKVIDQEQ